VGFVQGAEHLPGHDPPQHDFGACSQQTRRILGGHSRGQPSSAHTIIITQPLPTSQISPPLWPCDGGNQVEGRNICAPSLPAQSSSLTQPLPIFSGVPNHIMFLRNPGPYLILLGSLDMQTCAVDLNFAVTLSATHMTYEAIFSCGE
jgi:hypothetical protein